MTEMVFRKGLYKLQLTPSRYFAEAPQKVSEAVFRHVHSAPVM